VSRRHPIHVAARQRRGVEEVRRREIGEAHVVHAAALVAHAHRSPVTQPHQARDVDEVAVGPRVGDFIAGAHVRCVERIGKGVEGEAEVVVDGIGLIERTRGEQRARVLDGQVTSRVVVERLHPGLHAHCIARRGHTDGGRTSRAVFVRAVEAVEPVEPSRLR